MQGPRGLDGAAGDTGGPVSYMDIVLKHRNKEQYISKEQYSLK